MSKKIKKGVSAIILTAMVASLAPISVSATSIPEVSVISTDVSSESTRINQRFSYNPYEKVINIIEDGTVKTELLALLKNLNDLIDEQNEALSGITDKTERNAIMESYKDLINAAKTAIEDALATSSIELQAKIKSNVDDHNLNKMNDNIYKNKINALEDGTNKTKLLTLLDNLNNAKDKQREALKDVTDKTERKEIIESYQDSIKTAKTALDEELAAAGIEFPTNIKNNLEWFSKNEMRGNLYEDEINALEDGNVKTKLLALLNTLNSIKDKQIEALKDVTDKTERKEIIETYKDSIEAAKTAIDEALTVAGIELHTKSNGRNENKPMDKNESASLN